MGDKDLTLLVTLKGRPFHTLRLLWYLDQITFPYPILLADGGEDLKLQSLLQNQKYFKNISYTYLRYPPDKMLSDFYTKVADAVSKVKTPYIMLADNDDFPLMQGIMQSIKFLNQHADYVGCGGTVGGVELYKNSPNIQNALGDISLYTRYYCNIMDIPEYLGHPKALDRIKSYFKNFHSLYYAVYKTESFYKVQEEIKQLNFSDLGIHELYFKMRILSLGKVKTEPTYISYVREKGSSQSASQQKDWLHRLFYTSWMNDFNNALSATAQAVADADHSNYTDTYNTLLDAFVAKHKTRYIPAQSYSLKGFKQLFVPQNALLILLNKFRFLLKLSRLRKLVRETSFLYIVRSLKKLGSSQEYLEQLKKEYKAIELSTKDEGLRMMVVNLNS